MSDTKDKILDSAENLFASNGFTATSLRNIIKEAGVNTAAVHYHFGSKEGLIEAVLLRRVAPINEERIRLLDRLEAQYPQGELPVESVVEAFLAPVIRAHTGLPHQGRLFPKLMGRAITEPNRDLAVMFQKIFGEVFKRFIAAFSRALPDLSHEEVSGRMHLMIGAMAFTFAAPVFHHNIEHGLPGAGDPDVVLKRLMQFVLAGMRAPFAENNGKDLR